MRGITRRGLLTAGAASLAVLAGCSMEDRNLEPKGEAEKEPVEQIFTSSCRGNCMGGCPLNLTVRNGQLVKVAPAEVPFPEYRRICQRGRTHIQTVYNEKRIQYPLRRVEGTERGAGEWERISWEEAISEICTKWNSYREEFGPSSIGFSFASGNYGIAYGVNLNYLGYMAKLLNVMQATHIHHCYDNAFGRFIQTTGINTAALYQHQLLDAKTIIIWGANPSESVVHMNHFILEAQEAGAKVVVIDPNYTIMASKANLWIPIRPGTDGALALTLCKTAIDTGLASQDAMKNHNTFPFLVKRGDGEVLMASDVGALANGEDDEALVMDSDGEVKRASQVANPVLSGVTEACGYAVSTIFDRVYANIERWTPEECAQVTDVDEQTQSELLSLMVDNQPATVVIGLGPDHYENGYMTYTSIGMLSSITGNLGLSGGGMDQYVMATLDFFANTGAFMPTGPTSSPQVIFTALDRILETGEFNNEPINLKSIFFACHNALSNSVDYNKMVATLDKVDFIVTSDIVMTDTCRYSDIVLPAAHWFEYEDVCSMYSPFVVHAEKALEPAFESKNCYDMVQMLAKGLGIEGAFRETHDELMEAVCASETWKAFGIDWDRIKKEKIIGLSGQDGNRPAGINYSRADQRVNFYFGDRSDPQYLNSYYDMGQEVDWDKISLPHWEPPHEAWSQSIGGFEKREASDKYPLIYISYRNKFKCHTQFGYNQWMLELSPEPYVMLSSRDSLERGIETGDTVRVFNDRGSCVLKAVVNGGIRSGVIVIPKGWQKDQYIEGSAAELTSNHMNPVCFNSYFFDTLCEVELVEKEGM